MKKNVGSTDRLIRLVLGVILISVAVTFKFWWALIGIVPLATGLVSFCPVYTLLGKNTCNQ